MTDLTPSPDTTPAPGTPTPGMPATGAAAQLFGPSTVPAASAPSMLGSDAPEPAPTYGDFKLPEGASVDDDSLKAASALFADSGLSQEQAQKFIDLAVSREQVAARKGVQAFVDLQTKWVSEIKADPDIGGDKFQATIASAARAIDRLARSGTSRGARPHRRGQQPRRREGLRPPRSDDLRGQVPAGQWRPVGHREVAGRSHLRRPAERQRRLGTLQE